MADKTYIKGVSIKEGKYGLRVSFNLKTFFEQAEQLQNDKGYLNIDINKRKEVGKYGDTHYATLNDWKPEKKNNDYDDTHYNEPIPSSESSQTDDDLPFNSRQ